MSHPVSDHNNRGAHAVGEPQRKRPLWLWLLLALVLVALLLLLLSRCGGDDSAKKASTAATGSATSTDPSPSTSSSASTSPSPTATPTASDAASPDAGTSGTSGRLTSAGTSVLGRRASQATGDLSSFADKPVTAKGVLVQSVPADEGFWVGPSPTDRVWVQLIGSNESGYAVKKGDTVDFSGRMVRHGSPFAAKVGVSADEGAAQLTGEKAHIRVRQGSVALS